MIVSTGFAIAVLSLVTGFLLGGLFAPRLGWFGHTSGPAVDTTAAIDRIRRDEQVRAEQLAPVFDALQNARAAMDEANADDEKLRNELSGVQEKMNRANGRLKLAIKSAKLH